MGIRDLRQEIQRLRQLAKGEGWTRDGLADAIREGCQVSPLAAYRHTQGWTLVQAAAELNMLRGPNAAQVTVQQVSQWERGLHNPNRNTLDLLCRLYETRPDRLGVGVDYGRRNHHESHTVAQKGQGHAAARTPPYAPAFGRQGFEVVMSGLDDVRRALGETLRQELSDTAITYLERRVHNYDAAFRIGTSTTVIVDVSRDVQAAHELLNGTHSPDVQRRLLTVIAYLAGMLGITLLHLGDARAADEWLHIAELTAEQTADRKLRAWVGTRQSLVPLYYGNRADALDLANQALNLAGTRQATAAGARAATVQARVLAELPGQRSATLAAADRARTWQSELVDVEANDGILGLRDVQLAGHLGEVYTSLGDTARAFEQHNLVMARFTGPSPDGCLEPDGCLDYTLTSLNMARCHMHDGEIEHGCVVAAEALLRIPAVCCTLMVVRETRRVAAMVPASARTTGAWAELRDVLAFRRAPSS